MAATSEGIEKIEDMIVRAAETTAGHIQAAKAAIGSVIFGQEKVVEQALITVLAGGHAQHRDASRRAQDHVGDGRTGHGDVPRVDRQLDQSRLPLAELKRPRRGAGGRQRDMQRARGRFVRVGRGHRGGGSDGRTAAEAGGVGGGAVKRQCRQGGGDAEQLSDGSGSHWTVASLICPALTMRTVSDRAAVAPEAPPRSA